MILLDIKNNLSSKNKGSVFIESSIVIPVVFLCVIILLLMGIKFMEKVKVNSINHSAISESILNPAISCEDVLRIKWTIKKGQEVYESKN